MKNSISLDTVCSALTYAMGINAPEDSAERNLAITKYVDEILLGEKVDRVFMYNPDAIAEWIINKYPELFTQMSANTEIEIPLKSVMPSVTPVCFATMYTGTQPEVHGIQSYTKPVISIDTIFDALIRAGKRPVILSYGNSSISKIFLERDMDYFILETEDEVNAKAAELIMKDSYDFYVVYNGNYDTSMHKNGPESINALSEIRANCRSFAMFAALIKEHWKDHNTLLGFAMDHGCHEIDGHNGSHGLDMEEDLNIRHFYKIICTDK